MNPKSCWPIRELKKITLKVMARGLHLTETLIKAVRVFDKGFGYLSLQKCQNTRITKFGIGGICGGEYDLST
jgi:hypothetical protein